MNLNNLLFVTELEVFFAKNLQGLLLFKIQIILYVCRDVVVYNYIHIQFRGMVAQSVVLIFI